MQCGQCHKRVRIRDVAPGVYQIQCCLPGPSVEGLATQGLSPAALGAFRRRLGKAWRERTVAWKLDGPHASWWLTWDTQAGVSIAGRILGAG